MNKFTNVTSEMRKFFHQDKRKMAIDMVTRILEGFRINNTDLGGEKRPNCKMTNLQVFQLFVLIPFFKIVGINQFPVSGLGRLFKTKDDIYYDFEKQDDVNWRNIVYKIAVSLIIKILDRKDSQNSRTPRVLIVDDSDLPKTGKTIELIGMIFSHVFNKLILGFKALTLCWSDGRSQFVLDMSLHGEMGKTKGKIQNISAEQRKARYSRERDENSHISMRIKEYFMNKNHKLIEMVKEAIRRRIPFEYLLVDSWFVNKELVDFVCSCRKKFNLFGMAKMGNTLYETKSWGCLKAADIVSKLKSKYCRKYKCYYAEIEVNFGKRKVKLFFSKRTKRSEWKVLLTTDTTLKFERAYEIYSMRWAIEVFFADAKRVMGITKCQSTDFSSQIANVSIVMIRYNLLSFVKRYLSYETIGELFDGVYMELQELSVVDKIWNFILEVVFAIADAFELDEEEILQDILYQSKRFQTLKAFVDCA